MSIFIVVFAFSLPPPNIPRPFSSWPLARRDRACGEGERGSARLRCPAPLSYRTSGRRIRGSGTRGGVWGPYGRPKPCWGGSRCRGTATGWRNQTSVSGVGRHRSRGVTREIGRGGRTPAPLVPKASRRARRPLHPQPLPCSAVTGGEPRVAPCPGPRWLRAARVAVRAAPP